MAIFDFLTGNMDRHHYETIRYLPCTHFTSLLIYCKNFNIFDLYFCSVFGENTFTIHYDNGTWKNMFGLIYSKSALLVFGCAEILVFGFMFQAEALDVLTTMSLPTWHRYCNVAWFERPQWKHFWGENLFLVSKIRNQLRQKPHFEMFVMVFQISQWAKATVTTNERINGRRPNQCKFTGSVATSSRGPWPSCWYYFSSAARLYRKTFRAWRDLSTRWILKWTDTPIPTNVKSIGCDCNNLNHTLGIIEFQNKKWACRLYWEIFFLF